MNSVELITRFQELNAGQLYTSESDAPLQAYFWDSSVKGQFSVEKMLFDIGFSVQINQQDFIDYISDPSHYPPREDTQELARINNQRCEKLIELLQAHTKRLEFYQISPASRLTSKEIFHIIIGETGEGDWIGYTPTLSGNPLDRNTDRFPFEDNSPVKPTTIALTDRLQTDVEQCLTGVKWPSSYIVLNYFVKKFSIVESSAQRELIIEKLLDKMDFIKTCQYLPFEVNAKGEEEEGPEGRYEKFVEIDRLFNEHLSDLRVYVIGNTGEFHLYTLGKAADGNWVGISTWVIWT